MILKKAAACTAILAFLCIWGWHANQTYQKSIHSNDINKQSTEDVRHIYSEQYWNQYPKNSLPFQPREYVKIIRYDAKEKEHELEMNEM